jgi:serine O-acetyltransferase
MRAIYKFLMFSFYKLLLIPLIILFRINKNRVCIKKDIEVWKLRYGINKNTIQSLLHLLIIYKEFRSLFYFRTGTIGRMLGHFFRPQESLFLSTKNLGEGCFIMHGFSTILLANEVKNNFCIYQQVTVGLNDHSSIGPTIMNDVTIYAGALVLGNITIGNNVKIGAGAVVIKDIPDNCTVVGNPARIVKRNGLKVDEILK